MQALAALPALEELNLSGCHNLRSAAFVAATRQPSRAAIVAAERRHAERQMHRDLQPAARLDRGGDGGNVGERAAGQQRVQQHRHQDEGRAAGQAAAAGQQQGAEQRAAEEAQEGQADVAEEIAGSLEALGEFPVDGVVLPKVRLCCRSLLAPLPFIATSQACGEEQARQACCSAVVPQVCLPSHRTVKLTPLACCPA